MAGINRLDCHALVVGINEYSDGIRSLTCAVDDANAVGDMLETQHGFQVTRLIDGDATAHAIETHLKDVLPARLAEDGKTAVLVYFAGHGEARGDGTAGPQGYLLPYGSRSGDDTTLLSMTRFKAALDALECPHLLVVLDCCFAGAFRWSSTRATTRRTRPLFQSQFMRYLRHGAWQVLTSASHDELAADLAPGSHDHHTADGQGKHSPFAKALMDGLSGEADSSRGSQQMDGVITATELHQYIFEMLKSPDAEIEQTPGIWPLKNDNKGEFVFRNPSTDKEPEPDPPLTDESNPWRGLKTYDADDHDLFFGRQRVVAELLERVHAPQSSLLAVVGASGTGKSSVVKAGLIPRLHKPADDADEPTAPWTVINCERLGANPSEQLRKALTQLRAAAPDHSRLLFIDQFEELYTRCDSDELRRQFETELRQVIDNEANTTVLLTLRSDFARRAAACAALKDIWGASQYLVPALTVEEFRDCIVGPAQVNAIYFEPDDLVDDLLDEVMSMPGALPMLSFALAEMYRESQRRRQRTGDTDRALSAEDYAATGGVVGALHRRATELFDASDEATQHTIRRVFLRMLNQDGARITRRRVDLEELAFGDEAEQTRVKSVVDQYVSARLLVVDGNEVEPAHDTLIVAWEKLLDWLSEAGPQNLYRSLWNVSTGWRDDNRSPGMLWYDNPQLPMALHQREELNTLETQFVDTSENSRKARRRRRLGIAAAMLVTVMGVTGFGLNRALDADQARKTRDRIYLNVIETGNFFDLQKVLSEESQGGVVEPIDRSYDEWHLLVRENYCGPDVSLPAHHPYGCPFVLGKVYGKGRVMVIGHEALVTYIDWSGTALSPEAQYAEPLGQAEFDARALELAQQGLGESLFLQLSLSWLRGDDDGPVRISQGHQETLEVFHPYAAQLQSTRLIALGTEISYLADLSDEEALSTASVVVVPNAWSDFTPEEISAVERFVKNGGGLLAAGLGWSWIANGPHGLRDSPQEALAAYPMNKLVAPFNVHWNEEPIWTEINGGY